MAVFSHVLGPESIVIYPPGSKPAKDDVIRRLCTAVAVELDTGNVDEIESLVRKREESLSTRLSPVLALPHAILCDNPGNRMAVAVVPDGIAWDSDLENPVQLIVLLVGGREDHLKILSQTAMELQDDGLVKRLVTMTSPAAFLSLLQLPEKNASSPFMHHERDVSALIFKKALQIRDTVASARLILHADAIDDEVYIQALISGHEIVVVTANEDRFGADFIERYNPIVMPFKGLKRSVHVQFTLMYLLSRKVIKQDNLIVNVFGQPGSGFLDSIRITNLTRETDTPFISRTGSFPDDTELSTFTRVLQIAGQLAVEGREGKAVGTLFVVGDYQGVLPFTRQMIINPFHGYPREDRNILDPSIEETVKEFARIDGAFIVNGDGTIESAGTYLSGRPAADEMQSGLGARHAAAQGISAVSSALAVVISESTRKVTVFKSGRRIMEV